MARFYLVYELSLILLQGCYGLIRSQTKQYATIGTTVVLPCQDTLNATSLLWIRNEQILSDGRTIGSHFDGNERMEITGDFSIGEYNLQITNVSYRDSYTYTCEAAINKTTYQREIVLIIQEVKETTTKFDKFLETTGVNWSTRTTTITITKSTTEHFTTSDNKTDQNEFLQYALYVVGSISILALLIACSMCIYKCSRHRTKHRLNISAKSENIVEQSNNVVELVDEENHNGYEVINEDAMDNIRQIYSYASNDDATNQSNSGNAVYLEIVDGNRSSTNSYQRAVDIDPSERHNYEKPLEVKLEKTDVQIDATVAKELYIGNETSKELTIPKQRVQSTETSEF